MISRPPLPFQKVFAEFKSIDKIPYEELLWTIEWLNFRGTIKERDKYTCQMCDIRPYRDITQQELEVLQRNYLSFHIDLADGDYDKAYRTVESILRTHHREVWDVPVQLEVHHQYYVWRLLPWEYDRNSLVTLCSDCHEKIHITNKPKTYSDIHLRREIILSHCSKCDGHGYIPEFKHVSGGVCFSCWGYGGI